MIDVTTETLLSFSKTPAWTESKLGRRISPSTLHRWRLRGCRGIKLETLLIGGTRTTSVEALQRFFSATTRVQDGLPLAESHPSQISKVSHDGALEYLKSEGV